MIVKKYIKEIVSFTIGVMFASMVYLVYTHREITEVENPTVKVKTIVKVKTDTIYKTISKPRYIRETVIRRDTVYKDSVLPIVKRDYITNIDNDSVKGQIRAVVSGYDASLDSISYRLAIPTYRVTNTVSTQTTKYKRKHWTFTLGVGSGYGMINKKTDIFIGGMLGYSF